MRIAAILVAAGSGTRFGAETPKQFLTLAGKAVIRHAAEALAAHVHLLQPVGDAQPIEAALHGIQGCLPVMAGGVTRQDSVRAGLEALVPHAPDVVLVHDAARPVIPAGTIPALLAALREVIRGHPRRPGCRHAQARRTWCHNRNRPAHRPVSGTNTAGIPLRRAARCPQVRHDRRDR